MTHNAAIVVISYDALKEALGIPAAVELVAIVQEPGDVLRSSVQLLLRHEALPPCYEAATPMNATLEQVQKLGNN